MSMPFHLTQTNAGQSNNPRVTIHVDSKNCADILDYFIRQRISFQLSYSTATHEPVPDMLCNNEKEPEVQSLKVNKKRSLVEEIYDRYIRNGMEHIPPRIEKIAAEAGISVSAFKAQFNRMYGSSFHQMYINKKMEYAAELLEAGWKAVEVSKKIGYKYPIKFNKMFQKHFGMTPKNYQMGRK